MNKTKELEVSEVMGVYSNFTTFYSQLTPLDDEKNFQSTSISTLYFEHCHFCFFFFLFLNFILFFEFLFLFKINFK